MKLNWGTYIILAFIGFGAFIVTLVVKTFAFKPELVSNNYYEEELKYQETINDKANVLRDSMLPSLSVQTDVIKINFPKVNQSLKGYINIMRPSDASLDKHFEIVLDRENVQYISTESLKSGLYKLKIKWSINQVNYYHEQDITL